MQGANPCPYSKTISNQADRGCSGGSIGVAIIVRQQGLALYLKQRDWLSYAVAKDKRG